MRGQSEIAAFVLLSIIGISLFTMATVWSRGIFQQNVDVARVESAEKFMKDLNENVLSVVKFGGSKEVKYGMDGTIQLLNDNTTLEANIPVNIPLTKQWVVISSDYSYYIRERLEGSGFKVQLNYTPVDYRVELFTEGSRMSTPSYIYVERNQTLAGSPTVIKIKVTFS
jgi:hypothetical protein